MKKLLGLLLLTEVVVMVGSLLLQRSQPNPALGNAIYILMLIIAVFYLLYFTYREKSKGHTKLARNLVLTLGVILLAPIILGILLYDQSKVIAILIIVGCVGIFISGFLLIVTTRANGLQRAVNEGTLREVIEEEEPARMSDEQEQSAAGANAGRAGIASSINRARRVGPDGEVEYDNTNFEVQVTDRHGDRIDVGRIIERETALAQGNLIDAQTRRANQLIELAKMAPHARTELYEQIATILGVEALRVPEIIQATSQGTVDIAALVTANSAWRESKRRKVRG